MKLIAETAWHHEGDANFLNELVDLLVSTDADIIKFHLTLDLDEYMLSDHEAYSILNSFLIEEKVWEENILKIKNSGKELMLLYNDAKSIDFGTAFNPQLVEIHSVCLNDYSLLNKLKKSLQTDTRIVLGVGGSTLEEIEVALRVLDSNNIVLMFGFQNYPTDYSEINFKKTNKIMRMYPEFEFGYADHTGWDNPNNQLVTLFGAAQGMHYIEKHVTHKYGVERTDYSAAITVEMLNHIKDKMDVLGKCFGDGYLRLNEGEQEYSKIGPMKKAAVLRKNVKKGESLSWEQISFARTSQVSDLALFELHHTIGAKFQKDLNKNHALTKEDLKL